MRVRAAFLAVMAVALLAVAGPARAEGDELEVTGLQATAGQVKFFLAARGVPASELTAQSVVVEAGGKPLIVQIDQFGGGSDKPAATRPRGVVLVFDTSGSMLEGGLLEQARAAASTYAAGLPPDVELGLVTFADGTSTALAPTTDRAAFTEALGRLTAKGATALYDGVRHALGLLAPADRYSERRLVVLSDGADTASKATPAQLKTDLAAAKASLDVVAVTAEAATTDVAQLATGTGGQLIAAADPEAAKKAFRKLASSLSAPVLVTVTVPAALAGRTEKIAVRLTTGDAAVPTEVPVSFVADPNAATERQYLDTTVKSKVLLWFGVASVGTALLLAVGIGLYMALGRSALRRRLRQLDAFTADRVQSNMIKEEPQGSPLLRKALELSEKAVERNNQQSSIATALERAGIELRPAEWYLLRIGVSALAAIVGSLLMTWWLGLPIGLALGWLGTMMYRSMREGRRTRKFADLLPDALQLVVSALRSGFSLSQAIDAVVREGPEPINTEFGRALAETRLGGEMEDALERAAVRNGSRDLAWLVMAIRIQREVGGNLSEVLETATDTMRERARLTRHVRALSAEGRMSAYILGGMPILVGGWMFMSRREYLEPLYTEPLGLMMLGGGIGSLCLGIFWMSRIIKVEV